MLADSLDADFNPATTVSSDVELKPFVTAELGFALQAFVERGKLLSAPVENEVGPFCGKALIFRSSDFFAVDFDDKSRLHPTSG
jgi:hypothetical protein